MEISEIILTQALQESNSTTFDVELQTLLQNLEGKTTQELLNIEKNSGLRKTDNGIRELITSKVYNSKKEDSEKIKEISQVIFTVRSYLQKGILNGDIESILIFLSVNCYLQIEIEKLLTENDLEDTVIKPLSENILKLLLNVQLETHALPNAPYHEKKSMQESKDGFEANDIKRTYQLIESIERGGKGFHFNFFLESLISFFHKISYPYFKKAISAIGNPQTFVFYLQSFKVEILNQLAKENSLKNKWLNFELIRQIVKKNRNENFEKADCFAIKNSLAKIEAEDFEFFKQTIQYFNSSIIFNTSLGSLAASFSNDKIIATVDCFTIDKYCFHQKARNVFLESFTVDCSDQAQEILLNRIFERWNSFFNDLFSNADFYQNDLLITDFADFVLQYYTLCVHDEEVICQLEVAMNRIKYIDSEWSISESQHLTKFHLYHSQLYILSYAYRNKKLNDAQILQTFSELKQNTIQFHRYYKLHEKTNQFDVMDDNFNWLSPKSQLI